MLWRWLRFSNYSTSSIFTLCNFFFKKLFKSFWFLDDRNIIYTERIQAWRIWLIALIRVILTILTSFIIISIMNSTISCLALVVDRILRLIELTIELIVVWLNIIWSNYLWIPLVIWATISFTAHHFFEVGVELITIIFIHFNFLDISFLLLLFILLFFLIKFLIFIIV